MPQFDITSPTGQKFRVTAPEGATQDQVLAYAQQQFASEKETPIHPALSEADVALHKGRLAEAEKQLAAIKPEAPSALDSVGRGFMDIGQGVKQAALQMFSPEKAVEYTGEVNKEIAEYEKNRGPEAGTDWGRLGGNVAATAPVAAIGGGATLAARAALGSASGATAGAAQFDETGNSRLENAAVGGALGAGMPAAGALFKKALGGVKNGLSGTGERLLKVAEKYGIPLDAAQQTGSKALESLKNVTGNFPFSGAAKAQRAQQDSYNKALAKTMGEELVEGETQLTADVMKRTAQRIGSKFETISAGKPVPVSDRMQLAVREVEAKNKGILFDKEIAQLTKAAKEDFLPRKASAPRAISGEEAQLFRSELTKKAHEAQVAGKTTKAEAFRAMRAAIDESIRDTLGEAEAAAWDVAKKEWGNYKTISRALAGATGESGDVSGAELWQAVKSNVGRDNVARSTSELKELAELGKDILKSKTPDSGTAQRLLFQNAIVPSAAVGAGYAAEGVDGAGKSAAGLAAGALTSRALRNQLIAKALKDGVLPKNASASKLAEFMRRYVTTAAASTSAQPE